MWYTFTIFSLAKLASVSHLAKITRYTVKNVKEHLQVFAYTENSAEDLRH